MIGVGLGIPWRRGASGGGGGDLEPPAGMAHWYDPDDAETITEAGGVITQITDKSGNGHTLAQDVSGRRPPATTLNGLGAIAWDGTDALYGSLAAALQNEDQPYTLGFVIQQDTGSTADLFAVAFNASGTGGFYGHLWSNHTWKGRKRDTSTLTTAGSSATDTDPHVVVFVSDGTTLTIRIDGVVALDAAPFDKNAMTGVDRFTLGGWFQATSFANGFIGKSGGTVLYTSELSGADLTALETYLAKWVP